MPPPKCNWIDFAVAVEHGRREFDLAMQPREVGFAREPVARDDAVAAAVEARAHAERHVHVERQRARDRIAVARCAASRSCRLVEGRARTAAPSGRTCSADPGGRSGATDRRQRGRSDSWRPAYCPEVGYALIRIKWGQRMEQSGGRVGIGGNQGLQEPELASSQGSALRRALGWCLTRLRTSPCQKPPHPTARSRCDCCPCST